MSKLQKSGSRYSLTIPKAVVKVLGWKKGDFIEFKICGSGLSIKRKASDPEDLHVSDPDELAKRKAIYGKVPNVEE